MASHGYYWTAHWRRLRQAALQRDGYCCTVAGCGARATHVDHIATRPRCAEPSPADRLDNLRSLCATHDAQIKEHRNGANGVRRGRGGRPVVRGCDADGWPRSQHRRRRNLPVTGTTPAASPP
jgi:5-methylcytosine-specific restriction endonuclease McrA